MCTSSAREFLTMFGCDPSNFLVSKKETYLETILGVEFDWLEILYVFGFEKHITNNCSLLVTL